MNIRDALGEQAGKDKEQAKTDAFIKQLDQALAEQPSCEHEWLRGGCLKCGQSIEQPAQQQQSCDSKIGESETQSDLKFAGETQAQQQEPVANEVQLNIIRFWPDGFADRLEHVWKDLIGFIPNYKLHDLQRMLAEYGFTMKLYEGDPPANKPWVGLTPAEAGALWKVGMTPHEFSCAIEAKLREKNA